MTDTKVRPYYCTAPLRWPDPFFSNDRYKGPPAKDCWAEFPDEASRLAHQYEAHPEWMADLDAAAARRAEGGPRLPMASGNALADNADDDEPGEYHPPTGRKVDNAVSPEQLGYIANLAERKGVAAPVVTTKREASIAIDDLKVLPDKGVRHNKFDGPCSECGANVPAGEGVVRKDADTGRWITAHLNGCPADAKLPTKVDDGFYAVTAEAGHTSFYKVTAGRKPGVIFVDLLTGGGPNGTFDKTPVARNLRDAVLAKIAVDPEAAATRFGKESGRCCRCNRGLTDEASRERGIGPECAKR